jgi:hypothetical protein
MSDITKLIKIINDNKIDFDANGHEFVDLGLPSGTLWATCNIGATSPEEPGDHFAWGETEPKTNYAWETYKWCDGTKPTTTNASITKYCDRGAYGQLDGKLTLELEDDAAHVNWGGDWHMPTLEEFQELMDNCTFEWIDLENGNEGYKITGSNGNSIILPRGGRHSGENISNTIFRYWSANLHMNRIASNNHATHATMLDYGTNTETEFTGVGRYYGFAVRPVLSQYTPVVHSIFNAPSSYQGHELVDLGLPTGVLFATCNIGASSPEDYGCYFAWAETSGSCDGKTTFNESTYTADMTDYTEAGVDLKPSDDAAAMKWGGMWRMPNSDDIYDLVSDRYTTSEWISINGIYGLKVTSIVKGFEGNSIFLPAAGQYRSSTLKNANEDGYYLGSTLYSGADGSYNCYHIHVFSSGLIKGGTMRYYGSSIRPVVSYDDIVK